MQVIDLLSDEEDDAGNRKRKPKETKSDDSIGALRSVLPHLTDQHLQELVRQARGNLDQAVAIAFQEEPAAAEHLVQPVRRYLKFDDHHSGASSIVIDSTTGNELSEAWYQVVQSLSPPCVWRDPDFPPISNTIDGRSAQISTNVVLCSCGHPAASKKVQSDGPNYGRFYLTCGRPQKRRAQVIPIREEMIPNKRDSKSLADLEKSVDYGETSTAVRNPYARHTYPPSTPVKAKDMCEPKASPSPQRRNCNFFEWDGENGATNQEYVKTGSKFTWKHFDSSKGHVLYKRLFSHASVRQGAVGNCWFLSALAVVAEKPYLIQKIVPHQAAIKSTCFWTDAGHQYWWMLISQWSRHLEPS